MCATYHHFFCTLVSFDLVLISSKEGIPLHATHFQVFSLAFPREIRNFLAFSYSDNLRETCHFK